MKYSVLLLLLLLCGKSFSQKLDSLDLLTKINYLYLEIDQHRETLITNQILDAKMSEELFKDLKSIAAALREKNDSLKIVFPIKTKSMNDMIRANEKAILTLQEIVKKTTINNFNYYSIVSFQKQFNDNKIIYQTDLIMNNAQHVIRTEIGSLTTTVGTFKGQLKNKVDSATTKTKIEIDTVKARLKKKIDSVLTLTIHGPIFVGPSLYVDDMYGFTFYYHARIVKTFTFSIEVLNSRFEQERKWGGAFILHVPIDNRIIPGIGYSYLDGFGGSGLTGQLMFKNRAWMAGLSGSEKTGFGVKLLIGILKSGASPP